MTKDGGFSSIDRERRKALTTNVAKVLERTKFGLNIMLRLVLKKKKKTFKNKTVTKNCQFS